jgi:hypothetical protein
MFKTTAGKEELDLTLDEEVDALRFEPDRNTLLTASTNKPYSGTVYIARRPIGLHDELTDACYRVSRNMTAEDWRQYIGTSIPYRETCPNAH